MNQDVKNPDLSGLWTEHSQASKQYMSLKYFYGSILGYGLSRGHLYSRVVPLLPLTLQKNKQTLVVGRAIQRSVHPNIPAINHILLL